jgi:hypothetical protein
MMTASLSPSLALSRPATSLHLIFGFSVTMAELIASLSLSFSLSSSPSLVFGLAAVAPSPLAGG